MLHIRASAKRGSSSRYSVAGRDHARSATNSASVRSRRIAVTTSWLSLFLFVAPAAQCGAGPKSNGTTDQVVHPVEITDPLVNPDCGWGIWVGPVDQFGRQYSVKDMTTGFKDDAPLFSFVCVDWYWGLLEVEDGKFYWNDLDAVVNYWLSRGKQINMRLWTTYDPGWAGKGGHKVAPDWLFDKLGCHYFMVKHPLGWQKSLGRPVGEMRAPDYADPNYLPRLRSFLRAARDRFEPEPSFSFIPWHVGSYGPWGEWWVGHGEYQWPSDEAAHNACVAMQAVYKELFGAKCQMALRGDDLPPGSSYARFKYTVAMDEAAANGWVLGLHACHSGGYRRRVLEEYWPSNVHYGETNEFYITMVREQTLASNLKGAVESHYNWLHQYMSAQDYAAYPNTAYFEKGVKTGGLGYRFVLTELTFPKSAAAGATIVLQQRWVNRNSGRCWRKYPLAAYLADAASGTVVAGPLVDDRFEQTMWLAGQTYNVTSQFALPSDVSPGRYDLRIAMVDESRRPRIRLAMDGEDGFKRYKVGTIVITAGP